MTGAVRVERDSMGELEVPADALYGANTQRAALNFPISDLRFNRSFIRAIGQVKQSAAVVNEELGQLEPELSRAIVDAAREVIDGKARRRVHCRYLSDRVWHFDKHER